jgi:ATP-binding cassette subfamily B (MDR/TAP) protein 1
MKKTKVSEDDPDHIAIVVVDNKSTLASVSTEGSIYNLLRGASLVDKLYLVVGVTTAVLSGANQPANLILFGNVLNSFNTASSQQQNRMVSLLALLYVAVAVQMFITQFLQTVTMTTLAANQTIKLRKAYFQSLLRQPVSFFDAEDQGEFMRIYWIVWDV